MRIVSLFVRISLQVLIKAEKAFKVFFKQANYSKPLEEKIRKLVDEHVDRFRELAVYCQHERIQDIYEQGNEIKATLDAGARREEDMYSKLVALLKAQEDQRKFLALTDLIHANLV